MTRLFLLLGLSFLIQSCRAQNDGDLKLVGGESRYSGILHVVQYGEWKTVCNDSWTDTNTDIACKQLGYFEGSGSEGISTSSSLWSSNANCTGNEWRLIECPVSEAKTNCHAIKIRCIPPSAEACVMVEDGSSPFGGKLNYLVNITSDKCIDMCRQDGFVFASVGNNSQCACGAETEQVLDIEKVPFEECFEHLCEGDNTEPCGADDKAVVYLVTPGNCGGRISGSDGIITSPGFPAPYDPDLTCIWDLELDNPHTKLVIPFIDLADGDQIDIQFTDDDDNDVVISSGHAVPFVKSTEAKNVRVIFKSFETEKGFYFHFLDDTQCTVPDIDNGTLVVDPHMIYRPDQSVRIQCDVGLVYNVASVTCQPDGKWLPEPQCAEYSKGLTIEFVRTILIMVIVGLIALGVLFALTTVMLVCIKANDKRQSGYQGITTEIVEAPPNDTIQEERYTPITKDDIKIQLDSPDEDGEMDNNANEHNAIPAAEEDMDLESPVDEEACPADETVEADSEIRV